MIAGVLAISTGAPAGKDTSPARRRAGIGYGVLTGVMIAGYTLWDAYSVTTLAVPPLVHFGFGALLQCLLLAPYALRKKSEVAELWRDRRRRILIVGLLSPVGYLLVLFALRIAPVSLVAPTRELSIVLGGLAARRLSGSLVVLAGIAAIAVS